MAVYYPQAWATLQLVIDGDQATPRTVRSVPLRSATVTSNGYKESDKFSIELGAKELPLHPDLIRSCAVEIYMFNAPALDVRNRLNQFATPANLQILGLADKASIRLSTDGRFLEMEGQDYTSLLMGRIWPAGRRVPVGQALDQVVQQLVDEASGAAQHGRQLTVVYQPSHEVTVATAAKSITSKTVAPAVGAHRSPTHARGVPVRSDQTYWDVLYKLVMAQGLILYVVGDKVVISEPRILTEATAASSVRLVYGRNLKRLEVERNIGNLVTPQIIATSAGVPVMEARWPTDAQVNKQGVTSTGKITGLGTNREEVLRVTAPPGIREKAALEAFAKAYYEVKSRSESTMKAETKHLLDVDGANLLAVQAGVPVRIEFDAFNAEDLAQIAPAQRQRRLEQQGYDSDVAQLLAANWNNIRGAFNRPVYCRQATKRFSIEDGISLEFEGINYVDVGRDDAQ